jgi:hypothetical protein
VDAGEARRFGARRRERCEDRRSDDHPLHGKDASEAT